MGHRVSFGVSMIALGVAMVCAGPSATLAQARGPHLPGYFSAASLPHILPGGADDLCRHCALALVHIPADKHWHCAAALPLCKQIKKSTMHSVSSHATKGYTAWCNGIGQKSTNMQPPLIRAHSRATPTDLNAQVPSAAFPARLPPGKKGMWCIHYKAIQACICIR